MEVRLCTALALEYRYPAFKRIADTRKNDECIDGHGHNQTQGCADHKFCAEDETAIKIAMLQYGVPPVKGCRLFLWMGMCICRV